MQLNRRTFTAGTVAAAASLPTLNSLAQSTPEVSPVASPVADLEPRLLEIMKRSGVPGAVIAMSTTDNPEPLILELGVANLETEEPISADMHFRIGSVTKTFIATVVLQLVDEGLLTLDQTISEILPDLDLVNTDIVTMRNLLQMRSGLPQVTSNPEFIDLSRGDVTGEFTIDQTFGFATDLPASAEPDTLFDYNNLNFDTLGEVIHTLTGITWHENVAIRISEPLGLSNTLMTNVPEIPTPASAGYGYIDQANPAELTGTTPTAQATPIADPAATPEVQPVNDAGAYNLTLFNPTIAGAAGGMISTGRDQLIWTEAFTTGRMISPELYAEQIDTVPMDESGSAGYGYGVMDIDGLLTHDGAIPGFQSVIGGVPEAGINVAVLINCHPVIGLGDVAVELMSELMNS